MGRKDGPSPGVLVSSLLAYFDLKSDKPAANYEGFNSEILSRYGFSLALRAQLVHDWTFDSTISPRAQMSNLVRLTKGWLLTDIPFLLIIDKVALDRYLWPLLYTT
jgi:hypothetical protein